MAFTLQWEARAQRGLGQRADAARLDDEWYALVAGSEAAAEAHLDRAKVLLLTHDHDRHPDVRDAEAIVEATLEPFMRWRYAAGIAEVATTKAYLGFLTQEYRTPP